MHRNVWDPEAVDLLIVEKMAAVEMKEDEARKPADQVNFSALFYYESQQDSYVNKNIVKLSQNCHF